MAVKKIEDVTMVLVGREIDSDISIQEHLEDIYKAFCFFYGSISSVVKPHENSPRKDLLKAMRRVGEELLPLIDNYTQNIYSSFNPLPYTRIPPHGNRMLIRASQLVLSMCSMEGNLAGGLFVANGKQTTVIADQLPPTISRWICCRVSHVSDYLNTQKRGSANVTDSVDAALLNSQVEKKKSNLVLFT